MVCGEAFRLEDSHSFKLLFFFTAYGHVSDQKGLKQETKKVGALKQKKNSIITNSRQSSSLKRFSKNHFNFSPHPKKKTKTKFFFFAASNLDRFEQQLFQLIKTKKKKTNKTCHLLFHCCYVSSLKKRYASERLMIKMKIVNCWRANQPLTCGLQK